MANKHRGEVGFEAGDTAYTLLFNFNAISTLDSATGDTFADLVAGLASGKFKPSHIRALMWAGLQHHHKGTTLNKAGDLIDAIGIPTALNVIGEAVALAFPQPENDAGPLSAPERAAHPEPTMTNS
jgi:hypothetical protein